MKKLVIVCGSLARGGAERVTIHLAKFMKDQGIEVFIVTVTKRENEYSIPDDIIRFCLNKGKTDAKSMLQIIKNLHNFIIERNIDTVLIMGVPLCVYAIPGCLGTKTKVVVSERNDPSHFAGKNITKYLSRFLMKKADGYVFQTNDAKDFYKGKLKIDGVVIPNPLLIDNLPERYEGERQKVIVTAGRLNPQKNQKLLIDAFSKISNKFSNYKLVIYGEGYLEKELKDYVNELRLSERVEFPGNVTDLHQRIREVAIFVLSSDFEGMPNALIESMALGLPCISTDCPCGGPKELIEDGENGLLVPVGDVQILKEKMEFILKNPVISEKISCGAYEIRNSLAMDIIGMRWKEYLEKNTNI